MSTAAKLDRTTFQTSRLLDFCSEKELVAQTGHDSDEWSLVVLKELVDNALDGCEEAGVAPEIKITVDDDGITIDDDGITIDDDGITIDDDGPGIPEKTIDVVLTTRSVCRTGRHTLRRIGEPRAMP